jgi:hypothetical protein
LTVQYVSLRVKSERKPCSGDGKGVFFHHLGIANGGHRVQIGNEEKALLSGHFRHAYGRHDGSEDIAKVRYARALDTCKDSFHFTVFVFSSEWDVLCAHLI